MEGEKGEGGPERNAVFCCHASPKLPVAPRPSFVTTTALPCKLAFRPRGWREGVRKHEASVTERKKVAQSDAEQKGDENSAAGAGGYLQFNSSSTVQLQRGVRKSSCRCTDFIREVGRGGGSKKFWRSLIARGNDAGTW